jgi:hypothetical protein
MVDISVICGSMVDGDCCVRLPKAKLQEVLTSLIDMLLEGIPHADDLTEDERCEKPCWKIGAMGSRWIDLDARKHGLDHIRAAFYSKAEGGTRGDKPYAIQVMCEKAR